MHWGRLQRTGALKWGFLCCSFSRSGITTLFSEHWWIFVPGCQVKPYSQRECKWRKDVFVSRSFWSHPRQEFPSTALANAHPACCSALFVRQVERASNRALRNAIIAPFQTETKIPGTVSSANQSILQYSIIFLYVPRPLWFSPSHFFFPSVAHSSAYLSLSPSSFSCGKFLPLIWFFPPSCYPPPPFQPALPTFPVFC